MVVLFVFDHFVLVNDVPWEGRDRNFHILIPFHVCAKVNTRGVKGCNFDPSALRMRFHSILDVIRSAVLVVRPSGVLIRLPQAVIQTLIVSSLCGLKSITICA